MKIFNKEINVKELYSKFNNSKKETQEEISIEEISIEEINVKEIHDEFDASETAALNKLEQLLSENKIEKESAIERKGKLLKELGFESCETVKKCDEIVQRNKQKEAINEKYLSQLKTIKELKQEYPFEVFTTVKEFESICEKYNLIYAPAKNYVKDVPEKNVLEIANAKKLLEKYNTKEKIFLEITSFFHDAPKNVRQLLSGKIDLSMCNDEEIESFKRGNGDQVLAKLFNLEYRNYIFRTSKLSIESKKGIHIAAPKSHFNLDDVEKTSKFGFSMVTVKEVKDPIAFEFCCNDIVRIISKWGTPDDQSYLDERLVNETLN